MKIVVMAGSLRQGAYSKQLARACAASLAAHGVEVELLDMRDFPLPVYDGDLEEAEGLPAGAQALKARFAAADGFWFCSPEYNHGIPGAFKNLLDWASRGDEDVFAGKVAAVCGSSPGGVGGMRMVPQLRQVLIGLGLWLTPSVVTVAKAHEAFDADGKLTSAFHQKQVDGLARELAEATKRLRG